MPEFLVVFAKQPVPGTVKTRLVPALTKTQAAELYAAFLSDVTERWSQHPSWEKILCVWPPESLETMAARAPGFRVMAQRGDTLADRMAGTLKELLRDEGDVVVLTNSDSPDLPADRIEAAFRCLRERPNSTVFGPDDGGGYYLIGQAGKCDPRVFEGVRMGTDRVWDQTMAHCRDLGIDVQALEPYPDIDEPADLEALIARIASGEVHVPHTRRVLQQMELLP